MNAAARLSRHFRAQRMQRMLATFPITPDWKVLDVGGTFEIWEQCAIRPNLVLLNGNRDVRAFVPGFRSVRGDGLMLPFPDQSFDLVFSNSVIEHVGDAAAQARFAAEIRRVGKRYWVQTPDRGFPVEPHLWTPFLHFLPRRMQRAIAPRFSVWSLVVDARPDERDFYIDHCLNTVRLLSHAEVRALFPAATIIRERVMGLSKSLIAAAG